MLPELEGLDRWFSRTWRENLADGARSGALTIQRLTFADANIDHPIARDHLDDRWNPDSPLRRAAAAVLGYLTDRGVDPARVHLHGQKVGDAPAPFYAGFDLRYLRSMPSRFLECRAQEWIEVVHPTGRGTLHALRFLPGDLEAMKDLDQRRW